MATPARVPTAARQIIVTLRRSCAGRPEDQLATVKSLGLSKKIGNEVTHYCTPNILGMVRKLKHMVDIRWAEDPKPGPRRPELPPERW